MIAHLLKLTRIIFSFNIPQVADSETSTEKARAPVAKSLEEFVIDRLPNQIPVHDLQVRYWFHAAAVRLQALPGNIALCS